MQSRRIEVSEKMNELLLKKQLESFLIEDIGMRDLTSESIFPLEKNGEARFYMQEEGILAGLTIIQYAYFLLDSSMNVTLLKQDGDFAKKHEVIATVSGPIRHLLTGERVILNLIQRMSGIATMTYSVVKALNSSHTRICDTRKTTPGLRMLEKYAVTCGGGYNHRIGLYDGVMIKDNHIAFAGSITNAVNEVRRTLGHMVKVEVETESEEQVLEAVEVGADVIMFDNCSPEEVSKLVKLVPKTIITEASGDITLDTIRDYQNTGVDFISVGFITHSVKALNISLTI